LFCNKARGYAKKKIDYSVQHHCTRKACIALQLALYKPHPQVGLADRPPRLSFHDAAGLALAPENKNILAN
jgi:hypothetical protein